MSARTSGLMVLFVFMVGAILGAVPGWGMCFQAWIAISWLVMAGLAVGATGAAIAALFRGARRQSVWLAAQLPCLALAAVALPPLGFIAQAVEMAGELRDLRAEALARPDDGGPPFAWRAADSPHAGREGLAYDPSGEILQSREHRSAAWQRRVSGTPFDAACWSAEQVLGPFYRWDGHDCP